MAAPTHYSGEYNLGTGTLHHHNTAKALYAGSRRRTRAPPKYADSAGWITARLALGTRVHTSRRRAADGALHRYYRALCDRVRHRELRGHPKVSI